MLDGAAHDRPALGRHDAARQPGLDSIQEFKVEINNSSAKFTRPTTHHHVHARAAPTSFTGPLSRPTAITAIGMARSAQTGHLAKRAASDPQRVRRLGRRPRLPPQALQRHGTGRSGSSPTKASANMSPSHRAGYACPPRPMRNGDFSGLVDDQGRLTTIYDPVDHRSRPGRASRSITAAGSTPSIPRG